MWVGGSRPSMVKTILLSTHSNLKAPLKEELNILIVGYIFYLTEELVINGECLLTADSVMRLVELPRLTKIGDIHNL